MKILLFLLAIITFLENSYAQHNLSIYSGWTASKIQKNASSDYISNNPHYEDIYPFPPLHSWYLAAEYEYDWKLLRFSTGLSAFSLGSNEFLGEGRWDTYYLNIPLILGIKLNLPKKFGLTIETGIESGVQLGSTINVLYRNTRFNPGLRGNINGILGLEGNWNQFRLGVRLQIGLTEFHLLGGAISLHHSALTTYIGYTLWDSKRAKERKAKRLAEKQSKAG